MRSVTLDHARDHLPELLDDLAHGESWLITRGDQPVGLLAPPPPDDDLDMTRGDLIRGKSLLDIEPVSLGGIIKPFSHEDHILDEMING